MEIMDKKTNSCRHDFTMLQYNTYYQISRQNGLQGNWLVLEIGVITETFKISFAICKEDQLSKR